MGVARAEQRQSVPCSRTDSCHGRISFIDTARALAVLMMIQGHVLDALLQPGYRTTPAFHVWSFLVLQHRTTRGSIGRLSLESYRIAVPAVPWAAYMLLGATENAEQPRGQQGAGNLHKHLAWNAARVKRPSFDCAREVQGARQCNRGGGQDGRDRDPAVASPRRRKSHQLNRESFVLKQLLVIDNGVIAA